MTSKAPQVLIVGAGPSGLVLALSLLKNGIPVRIVEKDTQYYTGIFRGSGISPRTQEVEYFLGVLDDVKKIAAGPPILHVYDPSDTKRIVKTIDFLQDYPPTPPFPITRVAILGQSRHQDILRKHIEALGGHVELGTELSELQQDEDAVTVTLHKMVDSIKVEETASFDYIVGTDGGKSTVRKSAGIEFLGETKDMGVLLADVHVEGFQGTGMHKWGEANKTVVQLFSHGEPNMYQLLCGGPSGWFDLQAVMEADSIERLQQEVDKCIQRSDIKITKIYSKAIWRPNIRMASKFRLGRVFIAGDAAHIHPPQGGQGLNTSIMDSFNLAWKLALVLQGFSAPSLLDTYESERLPIISEMLKISTSLMNVIADNKNASEAFKKAQEEGIVSKGAAKGDAIWTRGWKLTQLDLNYRHSPVILDERIDGDKVKTVDVYGTEGHSLRAGDRAPEATGLRVLTGLVTETTKLFDIFDPAVHTVLLLPTIVGKDIQPFVDSALNVFRSLPSGLVRSVLVLPKLLTETSDLIGTGADIVVQDTDGYVYTNYGLNTDTATIVIVRPDTYIGGIVNDFDGIKKYFSKVLKGTI